MAITTSGKRRHFGPSAQKRITELKRQSIVMHSEAFGPEPDDDDSFPVTLDVLRRVQTSDGDPAAGIGPTWEDADGLDGLVGKIRSSGRWQKRDVGSATIAQDERVVTIMDLPATEGVGANVLLPTDHISFTDTMRGASVWEVLDVRNSPRDGIALALVKYVRERI